MLVGFRMIPALQRNSRNSERKKDVGIILQTISRWELNHSGNVPSTTELRAIVKDLTQYDPSQITVDDGVNSAAAANSSNPALTNLEEVQIYKYQKCSSSVASIGSSVRRGAGYHDVVALYAVEVNNAGATKGQCTEL